MRDLILKTSFILLCVLVLFSPKLHASEFNENKSVDLIKLAEQTLSVEFKTLDHNDLSETTRTEFEFMDAVLENKIDKLLALVQENELQSSRYLQYFTAYSKVSTLENYTDNSNYEILLQGSASSDWDVQNICSVMLAIYHSLIDEVVEGLYFAENALSVIPNNEDMIENSARFNAMYGLYILYAYNFDIDGMTRTLERSLVLAKESGRHFNKFSALNNLASIIEWNGNAKLATDVTNLLVNNLDGASNYDVFIANLSHGRFLLKDNRPKESIQYLTQAIKQAPNLEYEAILWIDLANAQAKSGLLESAETSLEQYNKIAEQTVSAPQYARRYSGETRALIASSKLQYKDALAEYKIYVSEQIKYYKDGLSADRRASNRRVLLSQELAENELEKAELKLALDQSRLARQHVINKIYLGLIFLSALILIVAVIVARKMGNLNAKLRVANATVIEKSKVKSDLLAMFSHEMLTPLNGIIPLADVLQQSEGDRKKRNLLKMIEQNGAELTRKIKDIIMISNPSDQKNNPVFLDIESFLQSTLVEYSDGLKDAVKFNVHMDHSVPERLHLDKSRLQTVVKALLSNAFKYTTQGEVRLSIYMKDGTVPVMEISDTGKGMPSHNVGNMLRPFEQASLSINRDNQGLGLGLSIVRLQCLVMEAELDVKSEENVGTVVKILFPKGLAHLMDNTDDDTGLKRVA
ncbi:MAG: HAMP domain-containing sensor histidine kinase [Maricaulaceae bacterium]